MTPLTLQLFLFRPVNIVFIRAGTRPGDEARLGRYNMNPRVNNNDRSISCSGSPINYILMWYGRICGSLGQVLFI